MAAPVLGSLARRSEERRVGKSVDLGGCSIANKKHRSTLIASSTVASSAAARTVFFFFFQAEDGIRDGRVTGVQTCALPICRSGTAAPGIPSPIPLPTGSRSDRAGSIAGAPRWQHQYSDRWRADRKSVV